MLSRRRLVATAASGTIAVLAGCTGGRDDAGETTPRPTATGVASTDFDWSDGIGGDRERGDDPTVSFDAPNGVSVAGAFVYGSSSCDRIALDEVTLDADTLRVRVVSTGVRDEPTTCTDDLAAGDYRATVTLDGGLPGRVAVTEVPALADVRTHTAAPD